MIRRSISMHVLLASVLVTASASVAAAHCCHDSRLLGIAQQNGLRPGLHGLGEGLTDESIQADPPSVDQGRDPRDDDPNASGGFGQLRGNGIGNYGAGSIGQAGPGGLGAMKNGGLGSGPAHPR